MRPKMKNNSKLKFQKKQITALYPLKNSEAEYEAPVSVDADE